MSARGRITKKRSRATTKSTAANAEPEVLTQTWTEVQGVGARPRVPAELYIVQGRGVYNIRTDQIASLRHTETREQAEYARSAAGRVPLCINAGTPTEANPDAGACFRGHNYDLTPCDASEVEWRNDGGVWMPTAIQENWCSKADAIARYAGGEALKAENATLFQTCFLNEGSSEWASYPKEGECDKAWAHQRRVLEANLSKLFLVCPFASIEPALLAEGCPAFADAGAGRGDRGCAVDMADWDRPVLLACLVTIVSDKSERALKNGTGHNISGYHDRCRLHVLPSAHVAKIHGMAAHFDLLEQFPTLGEQGLCENAGSPLERVRQQAIDDIGHPLNGRITDGWLEKRARMNCALPWVHHCSAEHPNGQLDGAGRPVLVPLTRHGAELRNGSSWLYLEDNTPDTPRYEQVHRALALIVGRRPPKPSHQSPEVSAIVVRLRAELAESKEQTGALQKRNEELEHALGSVRATIEAALR